MEFLSKKESRCELKWNFCKYCQQLVWCMEHQHTPPNKIWNFPSSTWFLNTFRHHFNWNPRRSKKKHWNNKKNACFVNISSWDCLLGCWRTLTCMKHGESFTVSTLMSCKLFKLKKSSSNVINEYPAGGSENKIEIEDQKKATNLAIAESAKKQPMQIT